MYVTVRACERLPARDLYVCVYIYIHADSKR